MIIACVVLLFALLLFRPTRVSPDTFEERGSGPDLVEQRWAQSLHPSWLATLAGLLSISTWGYLFVPTTTLDSWIGGANWITLVRDVFATLAFWFYREAVARAMGAQPAGSPHLSDRIYRSRAWTLIPLLGYCLPFALIADKGSTSATFVLDRIDELPMWAFASYYMAGLVFLSIDTLRMIGRPEGRLWVVVVGYYSIILGCVLELLYLLLAHIGVGGHAFRTSMYFIAELPFFLGIFVVAATITANALLVWGKYRSTLLMTLRLTEELGYGTNRLGARVALLTTPQPRDYAVQLAVQIENSICLSEVAPTPAQEARLALIWGRLGSTIAQAAQ